MAVIYINVYKGIIIIGGGIIQRVTKVYYNSIQIPRCTWAGGGKGLFVCLSAQWAGGHGGSDELQVQAVRATATSWLTTAAAARPCYTNPSPSERAAGAAAKDGIGCQSGTQ